MNATTLSLALVAIGTLAGRDDEVALRGLDPVALAEGAELAGEPDLEASWGAYTYRFASETSRATFLDEPERWAIQWDGGCGRMGPLSGKGSPDRWAVHDGRIYVFASDGCREGFLAAPETFVVAVDAKPGARASSDAAAAERGRVWIERAARAHGWLSPEGSESGGASAVAIRFVVAYEVQGWKAEGELVITRDGRVARRSAWTPPQGEGDPSERRWVIGRTPEETFAVDDGGAHDLRSPDAIADVLRYALRQPAFLLWMRDAPGVEVLDEGESELDGVAMHDVRFVHRGLATRVRIDAATGLVAGLEWTGRPEDGVTRGVVERLTDLSVIDGAHVVVDREVEVEGSPKEGLGRRWSRIERLDAVPAEAFERP